MERTRDCVGGIRMVSLLDKDKGRGSVSPAVAGPEDKSRNTGQDESRDQLCALVQEIRGRKGTGSCSWVSS